MCFLFFLILFVLSFNLFSFCSCSFCMFALPLCLSQVAPLSLFIISVPYVHLLHIIIENVKKKRIFFLSY
ncbi:hypothetical protein CLU79DRAFT_765422 [Phycomyces nitens]|nr:hypothetical protein CLU79DRAFT_765422 [Phycomyces nitens]